MTAGGYGFLLRGDKNVLKLRGDGCITEYTKNHSHVPFKRVNYLSSYLKQKQKQNA